MTSRRAFCCLSFSELEERALASRLSSRWALHRQLVSSQTTRIAPGSLMASQKVKRLDDMRFKLLSLISQGHVGREIKGIPIEFHLLLSSSCSFHALVEYLVESLNKLMILGDMIP